jgi:hypothetical protein
MNTFKISNLINPSNDKDEYIVDDFDKPDGWHWKEVDHLIEMGFEISGDTRLKLSDKKEYEETLNVEIYKQKSTNNYIMILNGRKHVFNSFIKMINFIESKKLS